MGGVIVRGMELVRGVIRVIVIMRVVRLRLGGIRLFRRIVAVSLLSFFAFSPLKGVQDWSADESSGCGTI